jgi:hypothetical protein
MRTERVVRPTAAQRAIVRLAAQRRGLPHLPPHAMQALVVDRSPPSSLPASCRFRPRCAELPVVAKVEPGARTVRAPELLEPEPGEGRAQAEKRDRFRDRVDSALAMLGLKQPRPAPIEERVSRPATDAELELSTRGRRFVSEMVPVVAAQASADAAVPLDLAANRGPSLASRAHAEAANGCWRAETIVAPRRRTRVAPASSTNRRAAPAAGRRPKRSSSTSRRSRPTRGSDVAGFLAFSTRTQRVPNREVAPLRCTADRNAVRFEDWNTFAIASALTGRQSDAARVPADGGAGGSDCRRAAMRAGAVRRALRVSRVAVAGGARARRARRRGASCSGAGADGRGPGRIGQPPPEAAPRSLTFVRLWSRARAGADRTVCRRPGA